MKLQVKIFLLVIPVVVLPLVWLGWVAYENLKENSRETTLGQMSTLLDQLSRSNSAYLDTVQANIELFSGSNLVKKYILTHDETTRFNLMQPSLIRLFASYQRAYPDYYELRILLPDGYEDTRSTLERLPNKTEIESGSALFQQLSETTDTIQVRYMLNPDNSQPVLYVGKKLVMRDESVEPIGTAPILRGYLIITASLDFLQEQLDSQRVGENGYLFVIEDSGRAFLTPQGREISSINKASYSQLQQAIRDNQPTKIDYNGQPTYVYGRELHAGLKILTVLPESDVLAAGRALGGVIITITLLTIILASTLIFYVINRILIQPIQKLGKKAYDVGHGRFNNPIGISSQDEVGELAISFEEMAGNLQKSQDQVSYLAYHDALTGLPNRRMFQEYLQRAVANARRNHTGLALLFLDLDDFKKVNDSMGHQAGDELLQALSERLTKCLRGEDQVSRQSTQLAGESPAETIARVGGDEFLVLLPSITDPSQAAIVAQRILKLLGKPFSINQNNFFIGCSIGISLYPNDGEDVETLAKNADIAMYHAKEHGRNNYQYFNESMNAVAAARLNLENELRKAISKREFILYYQPKIDLHTGKVKGVEALIRWQHPVKGMVPPNDFISVAEDSGLIVPIGEWVIEEATKQMKRWEESGIDLTMSINISTVQLNKQNVAEVIRKHIKQNGCTPELLEIELTETSIMDAHERATNMLNDIKSIGIQISMDDFGVGYSSFSYLRNLPIDILKIDRSFVRDITTDKDDAAIISAILAMAHTLNLTVVAEGVESLEQLHFLHNKRCDIIQGYLFSRPLPETELRQYLKNYKQLNVSDAESLEKLRTTKTNLKIIKSD